MEAVGDTGQAVQARGMFDVAAVVEQAAVEPVQHQH
jgi:hypothetical protein